MYDYTTARPNETKLLNQFYNCPPNWQEVAESLLSWLSDDEVKEWAEANEYLEEE